MVCTQMAIVSIVRFKTEKLTITPELNLAKHLVSHLKVQLFQNKAVKKAAQNSFHFRLNQRMKTTFSLFQTPQTTIYYFNFLSIGLCSLKVLLVVIDQSVSWLQREKYSSWKRNFSPSFAHLFLSAYHYGIMII